MAAGRIYTVSFANISVAVVEDLLSIQSTSGMAFEVHEVAIGQVTSTSLGNLNLSMKRFSGAYSIGSVGAAVTPVKMNFGDAAAVVTGRRNDTTQTSGGTAVIARADVFNVINGYLWLPAPEDRLIIAPSQAFVLSLDTAPGSPEFMSGSITIKELF